MLTMPRRARNFRAPVSELDPHDACFVGLGAQAQHRERLDETMQAARALLSHKEVELAQMSQRLREEEAGATEATEVTRRELEQERAGRQKAEAEAAAALHEQAERFSAGASPATATTGCPAAAARIPTRGVQCPPPHHLPNTPAIDDRRVRACMVHGRGRGA
jgi:hypothetical protein